MNEPIYERMQQLIRQIRQADTAYYKHDAPVMSDLEYDRLMDELSEDEIIRRKETEFTPMTEEEALIQIDLLGHDFFAYTDRDTNLVHILYRREDGGYGLLTQKED